MKNTTIEHTIISLVKSAIDGSIAVIPEDINWEELFKIGKIHKLTPLLYRGITNSSLSVPDEFQDYFDKSLLSYFVVDQRQLFELSRLQKAFEENSIDYMPVKGIVLKPLYPSTEFRPMGDGDILIRLSQKNKVFEIMNKLGYSEKIESPHEFVFVKEGMCIELHKCLIPPYNKDYYEYYGDGWKLANKDKATSRHFLNDNDHYIYMFTHFAKHYRDGGISALHIVDFWVYTRAKSIDKEYVNAELKKLELDNFHDNVVATMNAWFNDGPTSEMTEFVTRRIFDNGAWGTRETKLMAVGVKTSKSGSGKHIGLRRMLRLIFPKAESLQYSFPILKKCKLLLPFLWVVRWFEVLLFKRERLNDRIGEVKQMDENNVSAYQNELNYVGLDFNFKE